MTYAILKKSRKWKTMQSEVGSNQPLSKTRPASSWLEVMKNAETYCKDCKTPSPMVCVERCDVWRVKNEIVSVRQLTGEKQHTQRLLNAVKNPRRLKILNALYEQPRSLKDLQKYLKQEGFYHSLSTILVAYVKPLIRVGFVQETNSRYRITFYGRKVQDLLQNSTRKTPLPIHSCCYEETVIKELFKKPRTFEELASSVPRKSLSRILMRLRRKGLLLERLHREYVFYHKIKGKPKVALSPTEKRIFSLIPLEGVSAHQLSNEAKITLRRTYKYLRRLRTKKLVFALKQPRTYELTEQGKEVAVLLSEMSQLTESMAMPILQR